MIRSGWNIWTIPGLCRPHTHTHTLTCTIVVVHKSRISPFRTNAANSHRHQYSHRDKNSSNFFVFSFFACLASFARTLSFSFSLFHPFCKQRKLFIFLPSIIGIKFSRISLFFIASLQKNYLHLIWLLHQNDITLNNVCIFGSIVWLKGTKSNLPFPFHSLSHRSLSIADINGMNDGNGDLLSRFWAFCNGRMWILRNSANIMQYYEGNAKSKRIGWNRAIWDYACNIYCVCVRVVGAWYFSPSLLSLFLRLTPYINFHLFALSYSMRFGFRLLDCISFVSAVYSPTNVPHSNLI